MAFRVLPFVLLSILYCSPALLSAQNCGNRDTIPTVISGQFDYQINISDLVNDDLSSPTQGVCGVELTFAHQYVYDLTITLISPAGQSVVLIGPYNDQNRPPSIFARWFIDFNQCSQASSPDAGAPAAWNNNFPFNWSVGGVYTGTYHPNNGCLEDFNSGSANGLWRLRVVSNKPGASGAIVFSRLVFCDETGIDCCFANAGTITANNLTRCESHPDLGRLEVRPFYDRPRPDNNEYDYTYVIGESGTYIGTDNRLDFTTYAPGEYEICGFSYRRGELSNIPSADGVFSIQNLRDDLASLTPSLCGDLSADCYRVNILPIVDTTFINTTICQGDTYAVGSTTYNATGVFVNNLTGRGLCDSVIVLDLSVVDEFVTEIDTTLCFGNSIVIGNSNYSQAGVYRDTLVSSFGCDSIIISDIDIRAEDITNLSLAICNGDSVYIGDEAFFNSISTQRVLTNQFGCDSTIFLDLVVLNPSVVLEQDAALDCNNEFINIDASNSTAQQPSNFVWYNLAGDLLGNASSLTVDNSGSYILELTSSLRGRSCSNRDTIEIENLRTLPIVDTPDPDTLTCTQTEVSIGGIQTSSGSEFTYQWTGPATATFTQSTNQSISEVASAGIFQLLVVNTVTGCRDSANLEVVIDTLHPLAAIGGDSIINCDIERQLLWADSNQVRSNELVYEWSSVSNCINTPIQSSQISVDCPDDYQLIVTNQRNGCTNNTNKVVTADLNIPTPLIALPDTLTCYRDTVTLSGIGSTPSDRISFSWTDDAGTSIGNLATANTALAGRYQLLIQDTINQCKDSVSVDVFADQNYPTASIGSDSFFLNCNTSNVVLGSPNSSSGSNFTYAWVERGLNFDTLSTESTFTIDYDRGGFFVFSVFNTDNGCISYDTSRVFLQRDTPFVRIQDPIAFGCFVDSVALDASATYLEYNHRLDWSGGPCLPSDTDSSLIYINCAGTYTLTVTNLDNGCVGDRTVAVGQEPNAVVAVLADSAFIDCTTGSVQLDATNSTRTNSSRWLRNGQPVAIFGETPDIVAPGTYTYIISNFDGSCVDSASIEVVADCPILAAIVPPDSLTCNNFEVLLDAGGSLPTDPTGTSIEWLFDNPNCVLPGSNDRQIIVVCPGEYGFVIRNALDGNIDTAYVTVVQNLISPIANAGANDTLSCYTTTVELNANNSEQGTHLAYAWTNSSGDTLSTDQMASTNTPGIYLLYVANTMTGCSATDAVTIYRNTTTPTLSFNNTFIPCAQDSFALTVNTEPSGNYRYDWSGPLIQDNRDSATVIIGQSGNYTATVTNIDNGCPTSGDILLEQLPCPPCLLLNDTAFTCDSDIIRLEVDFCEPCQTCSFNWFRNGEAITGATDSILDINQVGDYTLVAVNRFGLRSDVNITVSDLRVLPEQAAGPDRFLTCDSASVLIGSEIIDTTFGFTYQWIDENGNDISGATSTFLRVNTTGVFGLRSSNPISGCSEVDTIIVLYDTIPPIADAGPAIELTCDDPLNVLNGQNSSTGSAITYEWTGGLASTCLEGDNTLSPIVACGGNYYLYVRDDRNGCISRDTVIVTASDDLPPIIPLGDTVFNCYSNEVLLNPFIADASFTTRWCEIDTQGDSIPGSCVAANTLIATSTATYRFYITNETTGCTNGFNVNIGEDFRLPSVTTNPSDTFYCTLDSLALIGNGSTQSGLAPIFDWTSLTGFNIGNNNRDTAYAYQPDRYFLTITDPLNGCSLVDSIDFFLDLTAPNASAGIDSSLNCQRRSIRLMGIGSTFSGQIQYDWSSIDGNIVTDANTASPLIDRAGRYLFSVTDPVNSCTTQDILAIVEDTIPPIARFADGTSLMIDCYEPTTTLDASVSFSSNGHPIIYNWRNQGVGTDLDDFTDNSVLIDQAGSYQLIIQDEVNRCRDTLSVAISSDLVLPAVVVLPPDIINCSNPTATLVSEDRSNSNRYYGYSWFESPSGAPLGNESNQLVDQAGDYMLNIVDTLNGCLKQITTTVISDITLPEIQLVQEGALNCETPFVTIDASASSTANNFITDWNSTNGTFERTNSPYRIRATEAGTYRFSLTNTENGCQNIDSLVISRDARFIDQLDFETIDALCEDDLYGSLMILGVSGGTPPYLFEVDGGLRTNRMVYEELPIGTYDLKVIDDSGCERTETFSIQAGSAVEISLGPDQTINLGDSLSLYFTSNRNSWDTLILEGGPVNDSTFPYRVSPDENTRYFLSMIDENGCVGRDDIYITVLENIGLYVPNTFSPNGDNNNDLFFPFAGPQISLIQSFMIFDRWGNKVHDVSNFPANNPTFGWDGSLNGQPLNTNVFVWQIAVELADGKIIYKNGDVLLQR